MAVSSTHNGWRYDDANNRLDFYYRGTRVGHINASGFSLANSSITDSAVTGVGLATGVVKITLVNGGSAGDHTVAGMAVGDEIVFVAHISTAASVATIADLTSEFTAAAGKMTNVGGTDTTNDQLMVTWINRT